MRRLAAVLGVIGAFSSAGAAQAAEPFAVRTSQSAGTIRVWIAPRAADAHWQAYLNGRDVTSALGYVAPSGRWIVIGAANGVRFGRNRLVVRVRYPSAQRRIVRVFTISRKRPLPAAGPDVQLLGPGRVQLTAAGSMPAHGGSLRYRWVLARKPAGSRARLLRASSRRARLITDRPGTYMLRLLVRERARGSHATLSPPSVDVVQVQQSASGTKQGIFVAAEGLTSSAGKLRVSGGPFAGSYAVGAGASAPDVAIFFDRATMEALPSAHAAPYYVASNRAGAATLSAALATAQSEATAMGHTVGMLLVATNSGGYSSSFGQFLANTVKVAGAPLAGAGTPLALYAVAGVAETSWISTGAGQQRELAGLLAPDSAGNFSFAPSSVPSLSQTTVTFATSPSGITVDGSTIASGSDKPCAGSAGGYQVRVLEASTLADVSDGENGRTFWTNACNDNTGAVQAQGMHAMIERDALASGLPARLVIVQGVGVPQHANPEGNLHAALLAVAGQIRQLGGSAEAFAENPAALSGPSYSLVGKNFQTNGALGASDSSPAEATSAAPSVGKTEAALSGALTRDRQWRFVVSLHADGSQLSGASGAASMQLLNAAETIDPKTLAPTQFPILPSTLTAPQWLKLSDYTARRYGYTDSSVTDDAASLCAPMPRASGGPHEYEIDVRDLYCGGAKSQGSWEGNANTLLIDVNDGTVSPPAGFSKQTYVEFLTALQKEGKLVDNVNRLVAILTAPFGTQGVKANVNLAKAAEAINEAVAKARHEQRVEFEKATSSFWSSTTFNLFGDLFTAADTVAGIFTGGVVPAIFGLAGTASSVAAEFADEPNGTPVLGPFVPGTQVAKIGGALASGYVSFDEGLQRTRDLIVSAWDRLQASEGISIDEEAGKRLEQGLEVSSNQYLWRTLLSSLFAPTRLVATAYNPAPLDARNYRCPVWGDPPLESEYFSMYFWRPWGKQGTFEHSLTNDDIFVDRNNLAPLEGTYIGAGQSEAFVLSSGGKGRPYKNYTNPQEVPPYNDGNVEEDVNDPPQNLPPGTFAPLFETPTKKTIEKASEAGTATPQGIDKQQFFPQVIRAASEAGKLETLQCDEPSQEIYDNGVEGYDNLVEHENRVPVGQPATATQAFPEAPPVKPQTAAAQTERLTVPGARTLAGSLAALAVAAGLAASPAATPGLAASPPAAVSACTTAPGGGLTLANVAAARGVVRAVGSNGLIASSTSLARWRVERAPLVHNLRGVASTGSRWVAVGDVGTIVYLQGGRWVAVSGLPNSGLRAIAARPGLLAAGGSGGVLLTSSDGVTWTSVPSGTTDLLWGGTAVGSTLLLSGQESTVLASADGASWRTLPAYPLATGSAIAPRPLIWQLAAAGPRIVGVGDFGAILVGSLGTGLRGVPSPTSEILRGVAYGGGRWVAVGSGGTVLSSRDGRRWAVERSPSAVDLRGVAWTGRRFVAVGDEGTVISSSDGLHWRLDASAMPCALLGLTSGDGRLVAVGGGGRVQLSRDGRHWHAVRAPTSSDLYAVARGPSQFIAVGAHATVLSSRDGLHWRRRAVPATLNLHAVAWLGAEFLAGGDRGELLSSPDGARWRRVAAYPGFHSIRAFATDGSTTIVAGAGTIARRAEPRAAWQLLPVGLGRFQTGVAYGDGRFVVVGHNGEALVSNDAGATWSPVASGVTQNLDAVVWSGSAFVATGEGVAIASQDGSDWRPLAVATRHSIRALEPWRGALIGVGDLTAHLLLPPS